MSNILVAKSPEKQAILRLTSEPLWFRKQIAVTASQTPTFFSASNGGDPLVSNMEQSGQLGSPNEFHIEGIGFHPDFGVALADLQKLYNYSYISFKFGSQERIKLPLYLLPDPSNIAGAVATTETSTNYQSWGLKGSWPYYPFKIGDQLIKINSQETFTISLVIAAPSVFSATFYASMLLFGIYSKGQ